MPSEHPPEQKILLLEVTASFLPPLSNEKTPPPQGFSLRSGVRGGFETDSKTGRLLTPRPKNVTCLQCVHSAENLSKDLNKLIVFPGPQPGMFCQCTN